MRKIRSEERKNGMCYCTFCKQEGKNKERAIYRNQYRLTTEKLQLACEDHAGQLVDGSNIPRPKEVVVESDEHSEADYQTWLRL